MSGKKLTVAQVSFARLVAETVAPAFKRAGFKKQGLNFRLQTSTAWMVLNIQKSQWNDAEDISFTGNMGVRFHEVHRLHLLQVSDVQDGPAGVVNCHWSERIGDLMPEPHDHWWRVIDDRSADRAAKELAPLLAAVIVKLRDVADDVALQKRKIEYLRSGGSPYRD